MIRIKLSDFREPLEDRHGMTAQGIQIGQHRKERIERYRQRAAKRLPLFEPEITTPADPEPGPTCMCCGKLQPPPRGLDGLGWKCRKISISTYVRDVVCKACFDEHGWWEETDWKLIFPRTKARHT